MTDHDFYGDHDDAVARATGPVADFGEPNPEEEQGVIEECPRHVPFTKPCPECAREARQRIPRLQIFRCPECGFIISSDGLSSKAHCGGGPTAASSHERTAMKLLSVVLADEAEHELAELDRETGDLYASCAEKRDEWKRRADECYSALESLAPEDGLTDANEGWCVHCGEIRGHDEACPWLRARVLLSQDAPPAHHSDDEAKP